MYTVTYVSVGSVLLLPYSPLSVLTELCKCSVHCHIALQFSVLEYTLYMQCKWFLNI